MQCCVYRLSVFGSYTDLFRSYAIKYLHVNTFPLNITHRRIISSILFWTVVLVSNVQLAFYVQWGLTWPYFKVV